MVLIGDLWTLFLILQLINYTNKNTNIVLDLNLIGVIHAHINIIYTLHKSPITSSKILINPELELRNIFNIYFNYQHSSNLKILYPLFKDQSIYSNTKNSTTKNEIYLLNKLNLNFLNFTWPLQLKNTKRESIWSNSLLPNNVDLEHVLSIIIDKRPNSTHFLDNNVDFTIELLDGSAKISNSNKTKNLIYIQSLINNYFTETLELDKFSLCSWYENEFGSGGTKINNINYLLTKFHYLVNSQNDFVEFILNSLLETGTFSDPQKELIHNLKKKKKELCNQFIKEQIDTQEGSTYKDNKLLIMYYQLMLHVYDMACILITEIYNPDTVNFESDIIRNPIQRLIQNPVSFNGFLLELIMRYNTINYTGNYNLWKKIIYDFNNCKFYLNKTISQKSILFTLFYEYNNYNQEQLIINTKEFDTLYSLLLNSLKINIYNLNLPLEEFKKNFLILKSNQVLEYSELVKYYKYGGQSDRNISDLVRKYSSIKASRISNTGGDIPSTSFIPPNHPGEEISSSENPTGPPLNVSDLLLGLGGTPPPLTDI